MGKDFNQFAALRILSVFAIQTAYVPDEYWQSLEVAHYLSFGYGYLTWEWVEGIRSYLYPLSFSALYKLLQFLHLDYAKVLVLAPRIAQALLTAYADVCLVKWIRSVQFGRAPWAKITVVTSWYLFYVGSRTLYNTVETDLTAVAFSLYPWPPSENLDDSGYVFWAALACALRPTAAVIFIPLIAYQLLACSKKLQVLLRHLAIGLIAAALVLAADSYIAGSLTFSPLNFVKANLIRGVGAFYGEHPGLWYLTQGIPIMLGIHIVPCLYEVYSIIRGPNRRPYDILMMFVFWGTVLLYSGQPHKETRFLLPLLPIALFWTAGGLKRFELNTLKQNWGRFSTVVSRFAHNLPWLLLLLSAVPSLYFGLVHQRGTLDVMPWLSHQAAKCPEHTRVLFLMPCHSTPLYSHIHVNVSARILTCVPDLSENPDPNYKDESDVFYENHVSWLAQNYPESKPHLLPSHIVHFDVLQDKLDPFLKWGGYAEVASFFHTQFPSDRVGTRVLVQERAQALEACPVD